MRSGIASCIALASLSCFRTSGTISAIGRSSAAYCEDGMGGVKTEFGELDARPQRDANIERVCGDGCRHLGRKGSLVKGDVILVLREGSQVGGSGRKRLTTHRKKFLVNSYSNYIRYQSKQQSLLVLREGSQVGSSERERRTG